MDDELELLKLRLRLLELETGETQDIAVGTISKYEEPSFAETFSQFTDNALNAASFGLSNYARAAGKKVGAEAVDALYDEDTALGFQEYLQKERNRREAFRQNYPKASIGAETLGAFANPVAATIGRGIIGQTPHIAQGGKIGNMWRPPRVTYRGDPSPVGKQVWKGVKGGATIGLAQSIGEQTRPDLKALEDVAMQTGAGAVIGGTLPAGFALLQKAWQAGKAQFSRTWLGSERQETSLAHRKMVEALEADYPGKTLNEIENMIHQHGPEAVLADAGPKSQALLFAVRARGNESRGMVDRFLNERQQPKLVDDVNAPDDMNYVPGTGMYGRTKARLDEMEGPKFEPHPSGPQVTKYYNEAYRENKNIRSDALDLMLRTPAGKDALKNAVRRMQNKQRNVGESDPELTALYRDVYGEAAPGGRGMAGGMKLETYDLVKRGMDRQITKLKIDPRDADELADMVKLKKDFVEELDRLSVGDSYSKGRALFSDEASQVDANALGLQFMRTTNKADDIIARVDAMSPEDQFAFRKGVIQAIREKIGDSNVRADITKKIFEIPNLQEKIRAAFGSNKEFARYIRFLHGERQMFNTGQAARGNSATQDRAETMKMFDDDPGRITQGGQDMLSPDPIRKGKGLYNIIAGLKDKLMVPEDVTLPLAKTLLSKSVKPLKETFKKHKTNELTKAQLSRLLTQGLAEHDYTPDPRLKLSLKLRR